MGFWQEVLRDYRQHWRRIVIGVAIGVFGLTELDASALVSFIEGLEGGVTPEEERQILALGLLLKYVCGLIVVMSLCGPFFGNLSVYIANSLLGKPARDISGEPE